MKYIDASLTTGERVLHRGKVSMLSMLPSVIFGGLFILMGLVNLSAGIGGLATPMLLVGGLWLGLAWLRRITTELAVTNKRLIAKFGLISRKTVELNLTKLESVRVEQSILGRLLHYGSIIVGGTGATHAPVRFIDDPMAFKRAVNDASDAIQAK